MVQPLFIRPSVPPEFLKTAGEVSLPDDPSQWPDLILQEVYKQIPSVADFTPNVEMDKVDAERGYGFGNITISNQPSLPGDTQQEVNQQQNVQMKQLRIPIIVKGKKLQPFDVLITQDSKALPVTEGRIRQALFRPEMFDMTARSPGDTSLVSTLFPPFRANNTLSGSGMVLPASSAGKLASSSLEQYLYSGTDLRESIKQASDEQRNLKKIAATPIKGTIKMGSLLSEAIKTATQEDYIRTIEQLGSQDIEIQLRSNKTAMSRALGILGQYDPDITKTANVFDALQPLVGQVKRAGSGYSYKYANPLYWAPETAILDRGQLVQLFGTKVALEVDKSGGVTFVDGLEKKSFAVTDAGHKYDADTYKAMADAYGKRRESRDVYSEREPGLSTAQSVGDVAGVLLGVPIAALGGTGIGGRFNDAVMERHNEYAAKEHAKGNNAWNPFGGVLTPTDRERAHDRSKYAAEGEASPPEAELPEIGGESEQEPEEVETPALISESGLYKVIDSSGKELIGYVFPNLVDVDGSSKPIALFNNGSAVAVQGEICGVTAGAAINVPRSNIPQGYGCFVRVLDNGKAQATVPLRLMGSVSGEDGLSFKGTTYEGKQFTLTKTDGVKKITPMGEGSAVIPSDYVWMPLDNANNVVVESKPGEFSTKTASAHVTVRSSGMNSFTLSGEHVEKLASVDRMSISFDDALFVLGGLGVRPSEATQKLAESYTQKCPVDISIRRAINTAEDMKTASMKAAAEFLDKYPDLRQTDLVKAATFIEDPAAVDTVLSLGFINPQNISTFISYLPNLDACQEKMCNLLIAARLGLSNVPTGALEKTIRSMESVIEGLKVLAFNE